MGNDGSQYLDVIQENNSQLWAQDPSLSACPSQPQAIIDSGYCSFVGSPVDLAQKLTDYIDERAATASFTLTYGERCMKQILKHSFEAVSLLTTNKGMLDVTIIPAFNQPDWLIPSSLILRWDDCAERIATYEWQQQAVVVFHLLSQDQPPNKIVVLRVIPQIVA